MFHLSSLIIGSAVFLCSLFAPVGIETEAKQPTDDIHYYETVYATGDDEPMPIDVTTAHFPYITKTQGPSHSLALQCPKYVYSPAVGSCASIAGGNVIGYFDRFDENLIPNHQAGQYVRDYFVYGMEDDAVNATIRKLYEYITGDGYGATEEQFLSGMNRFCSEKGKTISFYSCMQNGSFSYSSAKSYLDSGMPIVLFLEGYNVGTMFTEENDDTIDYYYSSANHIMIGFGYKEFSYITTSGTLDKHLLSVASGVIHKSNGLYDYTFQSKVNDALAVNIY